MHHYVQVRSVSFFFFFFNDTATTEIYTLSLHDALPICPGRRTVRRRVGARDRQRRRAGGEAGPPLLRAGSRDRKSTRLNSSHLVISYAVFCLKKKTTFRLTPAISCTLPSTCLQQIPSTG